LCFVTSEDEVLLLKGASNKKLWPGKYNGLGGHVEPGESVAEAAEREIFEEAGLRVADLRLRSVATIDTGEAAGIGLFVFTARALSRGFASSAEGALEWAPLNRLSELDLVEDLPTLLPRVLARPLEAPPLVAHYSYDARGRLRIRFFGE
jgi:8-oxo-dGTP diphosphatase